MLINNFLDAVNEKTVRIGVVGLGYVGLPLVVEFARNGFRSVGFEVDERKVREITVGRSYIGDVQSNRLQELVDAGRLQATTDFELLKQCDAVVICVPTPLRNTREPDISYILAAVDEVSKRLHTRQLIVLESTTYPGTTDEVLLPILEETGLKLDRDFWLAFSPERTDPGNKDYDLSNIARVIGGCSSDSTSAAASLYSKIAKEVHPVSSARVAETTKLLENTFRAVNIGMANEIARLCYVLKIDSWEVIEAAATKPFGFMPFYPGPGIGGHCIPLDPHYLSWKARQHGFESRFIGLAEEVNSKMPEHVVQLVLDGLNEVQKTINGSTILVLGVAYKKDVADVRESPAISIIEQLLAKGAKVRYHDPFVARLAFAPSHRDSSTFTMESATLTDVLLQEVDCVLIVTDHSSVDYQAVCNSASLIIDTRNVTRGLQNSVSTRVSRL